jgi:hypothetical protein
LLFFSIPLVAQYDLWTIGTAKTLAPNMLEVSLFQPLRYGITTRVEARTFLFPNILCPNIGTKIHWYTIKDYEILISTRHHFYYPTPAIKFLSKNVPFGIDYYDPNKGQGIRRMQEPFFDSISPPPLSYEPLNDIIIPNIFTFQNDLLISKMLVPRTSCTSSDLLLTLKIGAIFSKISGKSTLPLVLDPMIYQRTSVFHDTVLWYVGLDLEGHINDIMDFSIDAEFLSVDWKVKDWAFEHKGLFVFNFNDFHLAAGYQFSYGTYPDKNKVFIMPVIDLTYRFGVRFQQEGLFRKDPYRRKWSEKNDRKAI